MNNVQFDSLSTGVVGIIILMTVMARPPYSSRRPISQSRWSDISPDDTSLCWTVQFRQHLPGNKYNGRKVGIDNVDEKYIHKGFWNCLLYENCVTVNNSFNIALLRTHEKEYGQKSKFYDYLKSASLKSDTTSYYDTKHYDNLGNHEAHSSVHQRRMSLYHQTALELANELKLKLLGNVGQLYDHFVLCYDKENGEISAKFAKKSLQMYLISHADIRRNHNELFKSIHQRTELALLNNHDIVWFAMEAVIQRRKRSVMFNDKAYSRQWHLSNAFIPGMDINVTGVWKAGFTGTGVTVAVVDDDTDSNDQVAIDPNGSCLSWRLMRRGLEWSNADIRNNYAFLGSWDINDNDPDPTPSPDRVSNFHGTRCAGEIAAVANNHVCAVGVAFDAKVSGIRVLDGPVTDSLEAEAFNKKLQINDIYSCSWGPDDNGRIVDGPHILAAMKRIFNAKRFKLRLPKSESICKYSSTTSHTQPCNIGMRLPAANWNVIGVANYQKALQYGTEFGRHGYGSIFVVASGNGGLYHDNCNYDGYANSIYTVTIGAVDEMGRMPYYAEECASMLGVTFSNGLAGTRAITTTDWTKRGGDGCTDGHTGTSAAAPLAAGLIALMLNAQPCLSWRDVQYIVIMTSVKIDVDVAHWQRNAAGLYHSHKHGFGLLNAWRLVNAARVWRNVPWMTSFTTKDASGWIIPTGLTNHFSSTIKVTDSELSGYNLLILEYVQISISVSHPSRGKLAFYLQCPSGTQSVIGSPRPNDNSSKGFTDWAFSTVRCWGEPPNGSWTLIITDHHEDSTLPLGRLEEWRLTLFGTSLTPEDFQERKRLVEDAMSGRHLAANHTPVCDPPPVMAVPDVMISEKVLKVLMLSGVFLFLVAVYETFEYAVCQVNARRETQQNEQRSPAVVTTAGQLTDVILMESTPLLTD